MKIPITKPYIFHEEGEAAKEVVLSGWLTQGKRVQEFEEKFARYVESDCAIAMSSCTTALFAALLSLNLKKDDEVIVPSFSFIATANVVEHAGAKPVFVDIDARTYTIDPERVAEAITPNTRAIIPVHQIGMPVDLDTLEEIAKPKNITIVEDAACAIGSEYKGNMVGSSDNIVCFSLHPRKVITTGEGGVITVKNTEKEDYFRKLRHHFMSVSDVVRHEAKQVIFESYPDVGYNFRMTDIQAAVGIVQLSRMKDILYRRKKIADRYNDAFGHSSIITIPYVPEYAKPSYMSYILKVEKESPVSRDGLMQSLLDKGISTRRGIMAIHMEEAYVRRYGNISLPVTEDAVNNTILIPMYPHMTEMEQEYVIENIVTILGI